MQDKKNRSFLKAFILYQVERFPSIIILISCFVVALSSGAVILGEDIFNRINLVIIVSISSFIFLFHIRVLDEYRDYKFDFKYHLNRPIQRGIVF